MPARSADRSAFRRSACSEPRSSEWRGGTRAASPRPETITWPMVSTSAGAICTASTGTLSGNAYSHPFASQRVAAMAALHSSGGGAGRCGARVIVAATSGGMAERGAVVRRR